MSDLLPAIGMWLNELQKAGGRFDVSEDTQACTVTVTFYGAIIERGPGGKRMVAAPPRTTGEGGADPDSDPDS